MRPYFFDSSYRALIVDAIDNGDLCAKFDKPEFLALVRRSPSFRAHVTPECLYDATGQSRSEAPTSIKIRTLEKLELWFDLNGLRLRRKGSKEYPLFDWAILGLARAVKVQELFRDLCMASECNLPGIANEKTGAWRQLVCRANKALKRVVAFDGDAITSDGKMTQAAFRVVRYSPPAPPNPHGRVSYDHKAVHTRLTMQDGKVITGDQWRPPKE